MTRQTQYFLYGDTPVKMEQTQTGGLRVSVFDPATGTFQSDTTYRARILHDRDNLTRILAPEEFEREVNRRVRQANRSGQPYRRMAEGSRLRPHS